nr:MAG TPA: hypothetical protein [Inoviridae sp.]
MTNSTVSGYQSFKTATISQNGQYPPNSPE